MSDALRRCGWALFVGAALMASAAQAQDQGATGHGAVAKGDAKAQGPQPPGSNPDQPTDKPQLRAFCTDRPTKANVACILDQGHWQVESDAINITHASAAGVSTDTYLFTNPTLKYGLTRDIDLEANWAPYEAVHTYRPNAGGSHVSYGVGDLYLRSKIGVIGQDSGSVALTLLPYVKVPTAPETIGNGVVEAGIILPTVFKLSNKLNLTFDPEFDAFKDAGGNGRHLNMQQLVNVSYSLPANVTVFAEFWSQFNFDPTGTVTQLSTDFAIAYALPHDLQLDVGVNIGLNRATPAEQGYVGVSHRF